MDEGLDRWGRSRYNGLVDGSRDDHITGRAVDIGRDGWGGILNFLDDNVFLLDRNEFALVQSGGCLLIFSNILLLLDVVVECLLLDLLVLGDSLLLVLGDLLLLDLGEFLLLDLSEFLLLDLLVDLLVDDLLLLVDDVGGLGEHLGDRAVDLGKGALDLGLVVGL